MAESTEGTRQREAMFKKIDELENELIETRAVLKHLADSFDKHLKYDTERYEQYIKPTLQDYKIMKYKAMGAAGVLVVFGAAIWEIGKIMLKKVGI